MTKALSAALALALSVGPAAAQVAPIFDGSKGLAPAFGPLSAPPVRGAPTGWQPAAPDTEPGDANPGAPERSGFWDRLQQGGFDQICKNIKLRASQRLGVDGLGSAGLRVDREMQRTAAGTFALVDRAELDLSVGVGESVLQTAAGGVGISVGASLRGESIVVRPLGTKKSCDELGRLVNVTDFKAVLPVSPDRIAKMQVGELWRLPLTLHIGLGLGASLADLPAVISLGRGKEGRVSATLYKLDERQLRLRLRIDKADVRSKGGELVYSVPGAVLGFPETETVIVEQLVKLVNRQVARTISRYLTARLGASTGKRTGRMLLVEFILDPDDAAEMQALRLLLRGDLNALTLMRDLVSRAGRAVNGDRTAAEDAAEIVERHSAELGREPSFVGADDYERDSSRFRIKLPILVDHERASGRERDRVVILDETGMQHEIHKADTIRGTGVLDIPFLGEYHKHNTQRTSQVITSRDGEGNATEPVAVFVRQEGFLRSNSVAARDMAVEADEITRLIGVRGNGTNDRTSLPVEQLFPADSLMLPPSAHGPRDQHNGPQAKGYHRGLSAFTMVFNRKAVADIVNAPADVVMRSYVNALGYAERSMMERVLPHLALAADGEISYKEKDALEALGYSGGWRDENARGAMAELASLASRATAVLRDLARARDAGTVEERAARFLDVMAGDGDSGLKNEDILKVLVQLVDPADVAGEFFVNVEKRRKGEKDVNARLLLNDKLADSGFIGEASRNRARFAEPSILTD